MKSRRELAADGDDRLISTGEAAEILGVSRQHVANLCSSGLLPYSLVGSHRRVRRADVEQLAVGKSRMTRDQTASLLFGAAIAGKVLADPERTRALARENLRKMHDRATRTSAREWLKEWDDIVDGPLTGLITVLTSPSPRSRELRQNNPFAGVLSQSERERILTLARTANTR